MPWVKLDDGLYSNVKLSAAGLPATGLYVRALSYCGGQLTDGFVPAKWAAMLADADDELVKALAENGLWEKVEKGARRRVTREDGTTIDLVMPAAGYFIRDFLHYNPSKAEAQRNRSEASERARAAANKRWEKTREEQGNHATSNAASNADAMRLSNAPVPSRRDKSLSPAAESQEHTCPMPSCGVPFKSERRVLEHLDNVHALTGKDALAAIRAGRT